MALIAELTHRCPMRCPYCSNPIELQRARQELGTDQWLRVISQAADAGCMQIHFTGGEPLVRRDLETLVAAAAECSLYSNLITSGIGLDRTRLPALVSSGLEHVQVSFQHSERDLAEHLGGYRDALSKKMAAANLVREYGLPLTINFVVHRQNIRHASDMIALAISLDAQRIEIANVQFYGWALRNRSALIPTRDELKELDEIVSSARIRLRGEITIDYVAPDYYAERPKACMDGWGRRTLVISPSGYVLPCHAAHSIAGMHFENVRDGATIAEIWKSSQSFNQYRGTEWMLEPCRSCDHRERDWGGCRCQAFALTGDAAKTDPACALSAHHARLNQIGEKDASSQTAAFVYRQFSGMR